VTKRNRLSLAIVLLGASTGPLYPAEDQVLLFACFRENGQAGVNLATSSDGVHFTPLNGDKPIFTPPDWPGQNLTRDPSVLYRDGLFRMVWTSNWKGRVFGYAESPDLVRWSAPLMVQPFPATLAEDDQPENIWAPEIHWDPAAREYFILFAATTKRERTDGDGSDNKGDNSSPYDNRVHIVRTKDCRAFSEARLFFDQGFSSIDAVMHLDADGKRWVMVIKDSRNADLAEMPGRNLRLSYTGLNLGRPSFTPVSSPIAGDNAPLFTDPKNSMAEGPSLIRLQGLWWLYWDEPAGSGMNLATSPDLKSWTHRKDLMMPAKVQHGTAFFAPRRAVGWLR
jgi:hypothetical protein